MIILGVDSSSKTASCAVLQEGKILAENFVNIKYIFVTSSILVGGLLSNIIVLSSLNMFNFLNKPYKTKSDNIIQGQRSLKL